MIALTFVGGIILGLILLVGSRVSPGEDGEGVSALTVNGLVIIIALCGFLIAQGLFS